MANKIIKQIQLPNGEIYDIEVEAITNSEIDEICGATIYAAEEVEL